MGKLKVGMLLSLLTAWAIPIIGISGSAIADDLRSELDQAKKEIQELRNELADLKEDSSWKYQKELQNSLQKVPVASQGSAGGALKLPAGWFSSGLGLKYFLSICFHNNRPCRVMKKQYNLPILCH